nr:hypothetical protein [Mucilaginibacter sp. X5P1]
MLVVKLGNTFHSKVCKMYLNVKIPVSYLTGSKKHILLVTDS